MNDHAELTLSCDGDERRVSVGDLVVAGWTGRDKAAMEAHIVELEELGVPRPHTTPIFYRVAASLLTTAEEIQVPGGESSGEVEPVILALDDGLWVGVGSDHTDRQAETMGITLAKQLCAKPLGSALWRFDEVAPHWDSLILRSYAEDDDGRRLYQEGPAATMLPPTELMLRYLGEGKALAPGTAMYCGTLAVIGGIKPAPGFEIELEDPVMGRKISHRYTVKSLPVEG